MFVNCWSHVPKIKFPKSRLAIAQLRRHLSNPQRIYNRIGYGYLAAIGVGLVGSLGGLVVADYFQGQGITQLTDAQTQAKLLGDFERSAERVQLHSTRMALLDYGSDDFQQEQAISDRYIQ